MVDKLVEEICEAIAPGIFYGFDGCTEAQAQWSWPGHTDKDRALIREIAADALAIAQKRVNELEAENARQQELIRQALYAIHTGRSEPLFIIRDALRNYIEDRAALPTMLKGNGDG